VVRRALLVVVVLVLTATAADAQPDLSIRKGNQPVRVGDGIFNLDAVGQTRVALVRRQGTVNFYVRAENESAAVDDLILTGTRNTDHFWVKYFDGDQEISARMRNATYVFADVPPGGRRAIRVEVTARAGAPVRSSVRVLVTGTSGNDDTQDRVKAVVYRSAGVETPIEGRQWASKAKAQRWARNHDAAAQFVRNANLYWELAPPRGIRPEVAYAQSAKETAYGRFGGVVDASFRNPCGLKTTQGGSNNDPDAHQRFVTWRQGVTACIDHLALYAGAPTYPRQNTPDPRHFPSVYATAPTVERLGGRWAPDPDYGRSIVNDYLNPLLGS
jgi:hypothetical protein